MEPADPFGRLRPVNASPDDNNNAIPPAPALSRNQMVAIGGFLAVYAALSYYSNAEPEAKSLGAALSVGPVTLIGLALAWRWLHRGAAALITLAVAVILVRYWSIFRDHFEWADLAQQVAIYALVAVSFAHSLVGGRVSTCAQIAIRLHGPLSPPEIAYMRRATLAWALFYAGIAAAVLVLYFLVPIRIWSIFVNFVVFALIALAAVVDHLLRKKLLPPRAGGLLTALRQALIG